MNLPRALPIQHQAIRTSITNSLHWRRCLPLYFAGLVDVFEKCKLQQEFVRKVAEPMLDIIADLVSSEFQCTVLAPLCPPGSPEHHPHAANFMANIKSPSSCAFCDLLPLDSSQPPREKPQLTELRQAGSSLCETTRKDIEARQECSTQFHALSTLLEELDWLTGWRKVQASTCRHKFNCWETGLPNQCYNLGAARWMECESVVCTVS